MNKCDYVPSVRPPGFPAIRPAPSSGVSVLKRLRRRIQAQQCPQFGRSIQGPGYSARTNYIEGASRLRARNFSEMPRNQRCVRPRQAYHVTRRGTNRRRGFLGNVRKEVPVRKWRRRRFFDDERQACTFSGRGAQMGGSVEMRSFRTVVLPLDTDHHSELDPSIAAGHSGCTRSLASCPTAGPYCRAPRHIANDPARSS